MFGFGETKDIAVKALALGERVQQELSDHTRACTERWVRLYGLVMKVAWGVITVLLLMVGYGITHFVIERPTTVITTTTDTYHDMSAPRHK